MSDNKCPDCGLSIDQSATKCKYCGQAIFTKSQQYQVPQK